MVDQLPHIAHIGVAVEDLQSALSFYRDILGMEPAGFDSADGAEIASLRFGDIDIELLEPVGSDGPVARFVQRRGPGIHHICIRVPDLDRALALCREKGYQLIDEKPRVGVGNHRIAFLHPKSTSGILLELTE
ncbi:MAG: methylmalonyl-CoA epimerase [Gemmatimonadales bacterium]